MKSKNVTADQPKMQYMYTTAHSRYELQTFMCFENNLATVWGFASSTSSLLVDVERGQVRFC